MAKDVDTVQRPTRRLGYLCGAPRVSTRPDAESSGPRAHVVGILGAFRALGWEVHEYIVGDSLPRRFVGQGSRTLIDRGRMRRLGADVARILMGRVNARRAFTRLNGRVDWVYERFGAFQSFGRSFQSSGIPWILETQSPLFREAHGVRQSIVLVDIERRIETAAYQQCDVLVCVTEALRDIMVDDLGIRADKVIVVPNGVDTERFDPAHATGRRYAPAFTIGFVGSLYSWVGLDELFRSVRMLRGEAHDIAVTVIGDGIEREPLEKLASELGIREHVTFAGGIPWEDVPNHIAGFDLCYSGQVPVQGVGAMYHSPLKLYEYMAMERPVVASAFEDASALISHGRNGFLFEPGSVPALINVLRDVLARRRELPAVGRAARQTIVSNHSWVHRAGYLVDSVDDILARRRQGGVRYTGTGR